ncbi:TetR/AcrR family transcriptional regulator [uncultured Fibrella sp.]|uniref:TetR/AcrR family transcriptional regulator n=1 Tax=uncultured Fibrella sp. TaxID=1284596 RepID=UPI0035CA85BD
MAEETVDTETKIKEAARKVFVEYGYEGAKVRQIAEEAGVNIALLNYYFRSKEQLFDSIYAEAFHSFFGTMMKLVNEETPLEVKIWQITDKYLDFLIDNPMMPSFIMAQQGKKGTDFFTKLGVKSMIGSSRLAKQLVEEAEKGNIRPIKPTQFIILMMGNLVFPFIARSIVSFIGDLDETGFREFINERRTLIPDMLMTFLRKR